MAAAARTAVRGLSNDDLQAIRGNLASGRKPRVMFTEAAGQVAGQLGQVVELTDPEISDEWLVVRFGRDELPFSPADLSIPPRDPQPREHAQVPTHAPAARARAEDHPAGGARAPRGDNRDDRADSPGSLEQSAAKAPAAGKPPAPAKGPTPAAGSAGAAPSPAAYPSPAEPAPPAKAPRRPPSRRALRR